MPDKEALERGSETENILSFEVSYQGPSMMREVSTFSNIHGNDVADMIESKAPLHCEDFPNMYHNG